MPFCPGVEQSCSSFAVSSSLPIPRGSSGGPVRGLHPPVTVNASAGPKFAFASVLFSPILVAPVHKHLNFNELFSSAEGAMVQMTRWQNS